MPLADLTAIANLALSHLGEPFLNDYDADTGTTAAAVRLHLPQCQETILESHVWSFATRTQLLSSASDYVPSSTSNIGHFADVADHFETPTDEGNPFVSEFQAIYELPADCLRVLKIAGMDVDIPQNRFEIQNRFLLMRGVVDANSERPMIYYISNAPDVSVWPTLFTDAVAFLLAARLAPLLTQSQQLSAEFMARHEQAMGKARSKDARETRSKENHGARVLAARSGLVRARYGSTLPPY
jgi:hypothetical protein